MPEAFDCVIAGGTVYDGSGKRGRRADVAVKGDRIARVGDLKGAQALRRIDATGLAVSPGFIDAHTHSDIPALLAPLAENRLYAGVTTEIGGNCGFSAGPLGDGQERQILESYQGLEIAWRTQAEYFTRLEEAGSAINHAFLTGFGNIRRTAMGGDVDRPATREEVEKMRALLLAEIDAGAIGMSTGLIYPPGCYATKEEIGAVAAALKGKGLVYASHIRSEGDELFEALDEAVFIARAGGCALHVSHLKVNGLRNWGKMDALREWWQRRGSYGMAVTADRYPYCAGHTGLDSLIRAWTYEGGPTEELKRLRDDATWERIREELIADHPEEGYWGTVQIGTVYDAENKRFEGMRVSEIARAMGLDPVDAVRALLVGDETRTMAMFFSMDEKSMREILAWEDVVVGSDSSCRSASGPTAMGFPHPRTYGTTGRILGMLVREEKVLGLAEAVHKMTGRAAEIFGLEKRGRIEEGQSADIVVFDAEAICDRATYEKPAQYTEGVRDVLVNGVIVLDGGKVTGGKPGKTLRHGR
jgi:N-acyl-D-amino-acid deacylase